MTDPFDSLHLPDSPVDPPGAFADRLRRALADAILTGAPMINAPALSPYLVVADARSALAWYSEVLGARPRGERHVNADGTIGHAELDFGGAVLMLAEPSPLYPDVPVGPPTPGPFSHTLHLEVADVDATVATARRRGAAVERAPGDEPYGRAAVIVDPFGHRWMLNRPPA